MVHRILILTMISGILAACGNTADDSAIVADVAREQREFAPSRMVRNDSREYLAYEHTITVDIDDHRISEIFEELQNRCTKDDQYGCMLLNSSISLGDRKSAHLRMRIEPDGVSHLVQIAADAGTVTNRNTHIEDLTKTIVDTDRRLSMLKTYRSRLQQLEQQAADDVESLIRVTSELTNVQSQIEELEGQLAYQKQRVDLEIVNINLVVDYGNSLWHPVGEALAAFARNLSQGMSNVITAVAFLLPWLLTLLVIAWLARLIRRRHR